MANKVMDEALRIKQERRSLEREIAADMPMGMSLKQVREEIAKGVSYERYMTDEWIEYYYTFLRREVYNGQDKPDQFIRDEAKTMAEEQADMFVFQWGQHDSYDSISNAEIARVFGITLQAA